MILQLIDFIRFSFIIPIPILIKCLKHECLQYNVLSRISLDSLNQTKLVIAEDNKQPYFVYFILLVPLIIININLIN